VGDVGAATLEPVAAAWSESAARATPADRGALVADALALAQRRRLMLAGFLDQTARTEVVATRRGFFGAHHQTTCRMSTTARTSDGSGSGWASAGGVSPADVDVRAATEVACDKAERSRHPRQLDPGVYSVVLEPAAVAEVLGFLAGALEQREADEGRSPFTRAGGGTRVGERLFGSLTVSSDPRAPALPSAPFDREGMVRAPITLIRNGTLERLRVSRYWGKKTAHAADADFDNVLALGGTTPQAELVAGLDRGLLVTRFWYTNLLDPQRLILTGLTRDGVFLVEKGKVVAPVNNFRFNQSVPELFAACDAYGPAVPIYQGWFAAHAPALRCARFHMASRSDAV
jgi:predicted Zn-dependent protease